VAGTISLVHPLENTYSDSGDSQAQVVVVPQATGVSGSLTIPAWNGDTGGLFVIACNGVFSGTINANGKGYRGGVGNTSFEGRAGCGENTSGASQNLQDSNSSGGGGGANGVSTGGDGSGAGGGHGSSGENGQRQDHINGGDSKPNGGKGGLTTGAANLSTLTFGGAGGAGGGGTGGAGKTGGNSGGIIVVYAKSISTSTELRANGNNGLDGQNIGSTDDLVASGAGSGGSILIKSQYFNAGSGKITASGATGGAATPSSEKGGDSGVGRIRIESCSISGTTSPSASTSTGGQSYCGGGAFIF
jgi:hypothetical protein